MSRSYTLWHLHEAAEAISQIVRDMEANAEYGDPELSVDITHAYHHLKTAWNARRASIDAEAACSEEDFLRWRAFPTDIDMN